MKLARRGGAAVAVAIVASLVSASPAVAAPQGAPTASEPGLTSAQSRGRVAALQARGRAEVDKRLSTIAALTQKLAANRHLGDADRAALSRQIQSVSLRLTASGVRIAGGTEVAAIEQDVRAVMGESVIYRILVPKVEIVLRADALAVEVERTAAALATLLRTRSRTISDAQVSVARAAISSAAGRTAGVTEATLAVALDGSAADSWFGSAMADLAAANADLRNASIAIRVLQRSTR